MLNQSIVIIVSFLDFYKKTKDVVSLLKMQIYGVFFFVLGGLTLGVGL